MNSVREGRILKIALISLGMAFCQTGLLWTDTALAATMGKVGYIDYKRVVQSIVIGREAAKAIEADKTQTTKEVEALEKEVDAIRQALTGKEPTAEELEAVKKRQEALRNKLEELNQKKYDLPRKQGERVQRVQKQLRDKVKEAVVQYGKEHGFVLVFNRVKGNLFYADEELNITDGVIEMLNRATAGPASAPEKK